MCPSDLVVLISGLTISLAQGRTEEEIGLLAVIFCQLGDSLATYAAQLALCTPEDTEIL